MSNQALLTLRQLFAACHDFVDLLGREAVLALALVSREVWNLARGLIEKRYAFRMKFDAQRFGGSEPIQFRRYAPRSFRLMGIDEDAPFFVVPESVVSLRIMFAQRALENERAFALVERYIGATHLRLTELTFCAVFNGPVDRLPSCVTHLKFGWYFNQPVEHLPPRLTHLRFGERFNRPVDHLPPSVTHLTFEDDFNQPVEHLPPGVTHLRFGHNFNQTVDRLPAGVTYLTFGAHFNQPVDRLSRGVTRLAFGYRFNQQVEHLPLGVTHLEFGRSFAQPIDALPSAVTHLGLGRAFPGSLEQLPRRLEFLTFLEAHTWSWEEIETGLDVVWLECGQALTAEQVSQVSRPPGHGFRWKKAAPPLAKRKRDEDEGGPSVKRA